MKKTYRIENLCCANCAAKIERELNRIPGITSASVNFMTLRLSVQSETEDWDGLMRDVLRVFRKIEPDCSVIVK